MNEVTTPDNGNALVDEFLKQNPVKDYSNFSELLLLKSKLDGFLSSTYGELTPEIEHYSVEIFSRLLKKVDGYYFMISAYTAQADHFKARAKEMLAFAKANERLVDGLKERVLFNMQSNGMDEIQGDSIRAYLVNNKPALEIYDAAVLPEDLKVQQISYIPNKDEIKKRLDQMELIPGAKLVGGVHVRFGKPNVGKK